MKLSDNYSSSAGNASASVGASSLAVYNCYSNRAPISHASSSTTYGGGTSSNYGHVILSDNYTSSAGNAASSIGASSLAVYNAYNAIRSGIGVGYLSAYNSSGSTTKNQSITTTDSWVTVTGTDFTPSSTGTYIILGCIVFASNTSSSSYGAIRVKVGDSGFSGYERIASFYPSGTSRYVNVCFPYRDTTLYTYTLQVYCKTTETVKEAEIAYVRLRT